MMVRGMLFSPAMARANVTGLKTQTRRAAGNVNAQRLLKAWREGAANTETCGQQAKASATARPQRPANVSERNSREGLQSKIILYQREAFRLETGFDDLPPSAIKALTFNHMPVWFEADAGAPSARTRSQWGHPFGRLRPGLHMPKWASRAVLTVADIRMEPLGAISAEDAIAEGLSAHRLNGETRYGIFGRTGTPSASAGGWDWDDWEGDPRAAFFRLFSGVNRAGANDLDKDQPVIAITYAVSERNVCELERRAA